MEMDGVIRGSGALYAPVDSSYDYFDYNLQMGEWVLHDERRLIQAEVRSLKNAGASYSSPNNQNRIHQYVQHNQLDSTPYDQDFQSLASLNPEAEEKFEFKTKLTPANRHFKLLQPQTLNQMEMAMSRTTQTFRFNKTNPHYDK